MQELRPYQQRALANLRAQFAAGRKRVLLVAPVGAGKTTIFSKIVSGTSEAGQPVLVLAHRKELIDQASARLDGFGVKHGVIMAGHPRRVPSALVQVASIQTLHNRPKPEARVVVVDEAHRAKAKTWMTTLDYYPNSLVCGFTATPWRLDGKGLGDLFESVVVAAQPRELVNEGFLCPVMGFGYDRPDLHEVKTVQGDFAQGQLSTVMSKPRIVGNVVEQWLTRAAGMSTVLFAVNVEHSMLMCSQFRAAGVSAEHLDGTTPKAEREAILKRVASGETQVVCNVNVLTEGTDIPRLKCCILCRPTKSVSLYIQSVGRVRRPWQGVTARVHDHAGCLQMHGLPDMERDFSLTTTPKKKGAPVDSVTVCKQCFAIFDKRDYPEGCPCCGFKATNGPRGGPEHVSEGDLIEFDGLEFKEVTKGVEVAPDPIMKAAWLKLTAEAASRGYKQGWAFHKFKDRYGQLPHWSWQNQEV